MIVAPVTLDEGATEVLEEAEAVEVGAAVPGALATKGLLAAALPP